MKRTRLVLPHLSTGKETQSHLVHQVRIFPHGGLRVSLGWNQLGDDDATCKWAENSFLQCWNCLNPPTRGSLTLDLERRALKLKE